MDSSKSKMVIMFVLLLIKFEGGWSEGCLDHEIFALFRLKYFFNDLHDWVDDEGATDCCQWVRVECNNTTDRVIALDLSDTRNWDLGEWYLNASLFTPFQQLESLDLSWNKIAGCVENEGLERLSKLNNLKMLDLSENLFDNSILSFVGRLSSLRSLKLSYNRLEGSIDVKELDSLRDLEELDIGWNKIDKFVVSKGLRKLKYLGLSGNKLNHSILSSLTIFSLLRELYLRDTGFKGTFDVREFNSFNNLEALDMSNNEIDNLVVPQGYRGLRNLKSLDLSEVGIRDGSNLLRSMGSFPSLNTLYLTSNNFIDTTSELHNFTNLEYLALDSSSLHISLLQSIASFTSLKILTMTNCEVNGVLSGQELHNFANLEYLALDFSSLHTSLLQSIASFTSLKKLSMTNCEVNGVLSGQALETLSRLTNLKMLDLRGNLFNNSILSSLAHLSSLTSLDLSENKLEGSINVKEFDSLSNLEELDMSHNEIDNLEVPQGYKGLRKLNYLDLSRVGIRDGSKLLQSMGSFPSLNTLYLRDNNFTDIATTTTQGLERLSNLKRLDLSHNLFNNSILSSVAHLSSLTSLDLSENRLEGSINVKEFDSLSNLEELDMSYNEIDNFEVPQGYRGLRKLKSLYLSNVGVRDGSKLLQSMGSFPSLNTLYLKDNNFTDIATTTTQALETLSRLSNLTILDLSYNLFNNSILSFVARLSSLTSLDLSYNGLEGSINVKEFDSLSNLEELDMSGNEIDNFKVPQGYRGLKKLKSLYLSNVGVRDGSKLLQSMGSFPSLNTLYLKDNNFTDIATTTTQGFPHFKSLEHLGMMSTRIALNTNFLQVISESMPSLKYLSLSYSTLGTNSSRILDRGLCSPVHLQELYIGSNDLRGSLPWCMTNLTSLRILDVSSNQLTGSISSSPLIHLTSIEKLYLSNNHFQIPISLEPLFNHSRLKTFYADNNELNAEITQSHSLTAPNFQLSRLSLSSGYEDGVTFPKFLYHQHDLETVELSHIKMNGEFPTWLLENNTKLRQLSLVNDSLGGPFRLPIHSHKRLGMLDISNNNFRGHIPIEIGDVLPSLYLFNNSMNALDGSIPSSLGNMKFLQILDLSNNHLTGEIPEHLAVGCVNLQSLALSNNNLQGHMFSRNFNLINLKWLQLEGNRFIGEIPQSLSKCSSLEGLYLNNNSLSGKIPRWLGNLTWLQYIIMPNNHLEGPIPVEFCQLDLLQILDISDNNISGSLPSCFHPLSIKQVHLSKNMLHGQLKRGTFFNCSSLVILDLSYNRLNGSIPDWVDGLSQLSHLILGHNNLEGEVLVQLCELNQLQLLDLSNNNLHGPIPPCFDNTTLYESYSNSSSLDEQFEIFFSIESPQGNVEKQIHEIFEFTTKNIVYIYQGKVRSLLSGLDLSCNKLIGPIPPQIGNLTRIQTLNLSHNDLIGLIPSTFSNLKHVESLDLSNNKLNGKIPHQLVELKTLEVFSVAYNNLSGEIPEWTAQFATFNESSYEGNTFLCGLPLPICRSPATMSEASIGNERDDNLIDMDSFFITFTTSYVIVIFAIVIILYVNSYWRRRWFYFVEMWITSSYYFVVDNLIPTRFYH
ncbi:receptor-like protein 1 isoform X5 [Citrus sinensis]|uniref:receptor-like protein 1 isoform X5 n=1 Tax=Citrus sinensis TaxID=2711 RepID=UPI0022795598|nr:receptor-like protein 1 isoform X5 [Citrus sinensis]